MTEIAVGKAGLPDRLVGIVNTQALTADIKAQRATRLGGHRGDGIEVSPDQLETLIRVAIVANERRKLEKELLANESAATTAYVYMGETLDRLLSSVVTDAESAAGRP